MTSSSTPAATALRACTGSGDVAVGDAPGEVRIKTASGDIAHRRHLPRRGVRQGGVSGSIRGRCPQRDGRSASTCARSAGGCAARLDEPATPRRRRAAGPPHPGDGQRQRRAGPGLTPWSPATTSRPGPRPSPSGRRSAAVCATRCVGRRRRRSRSSCGAPGAVVRRSTGSSTCWPPSPPSGFLVPVVVPTADRRSATSTASSLPPRSTADRRAATTTGMPSPPSCGGSTTSRQHGASVPGFLTARQLLTERRGGDVDLDRHARRRRRPRPRRVGRGCPTSRAPSCTVTSVSSSIRLVDGRVGLIGWDDARRSTTRGSISPTCPCATSTAATSWRPARPPTPGRRPAPGPTNRPTPAGASSCSTATGSCTDARRPSPR